MSSEEAVTDDKTEEATEPVANEIIETTNEEEPTEPIKQEETTTTAPVEQTTEQTQPTAKAKPKAQPKKLARSVKVVELVECEACNKKMLPKSLRNTHPHYCKGQPTETLPVNRQKASYGAKVEQKLRKEIEEEMKAKYSKQEQPKQNEVVAKPREALTSVAKPREALTSVAKPREALTSVQYSDPIEVKTQYKPVRMEEQPRQLTAREILEASYKEIRRAKREEHMQKINSFKSKMF